VASFVKFHSVVEELAEAGHNLGSDTLKVALSNTAPTASSNTLLANITQIGNGNGYTTGGATVTITASSQTSGTYKLVGNDVVFTASGAVGPFQYSILYNDTSTGDKLIGYWDNGSSVTLASGDTFTVDFSAANGILQLA
jgi:hypothetical protein